MLRAFGGKKGVSVKKGSCAFRSPANRGGEVRSGKCSQNVLLGGRGRFSKKLGFSKVWFMTGEKGAWR